MFRNARLGVLVLMTVAMVAPASAADVNDVLTAAQNAARKLRRFAYEARAWQEGGEKAPQFDGKITLYRRSSLEKCRYFASGKARDCPTCPDGKFEVICDGRTAAAIDHDQKLYLWQEAENSDELMQPALSLRVDELLKRVPYQDLLRAGAKQEGMQTVSGHDCVVITAQVDDQTHRYFLSATDYLPRRVERVDGEARTIVEIREYELKPEVSSRDFRPEAPLGYTKIKYTPSDDRPSVFVSTMDGHDFTLQDAEGNEVSTKALRGKVIVLDFWATWCGPCKRAMPTVQSIHKKYKDKDVVVLGVNVWERGGWDKGPKYMEDNGYTYKCLLRGNAVAKAYGVRGIPTLVVLDKEGKITFKESGIPNEGELSSAIDSALKG